jgi:hypothetical protein
LPSIRQCQAVVARSPSHFPRAGTRFVHSTMAASRARATALARLRVLLDVLEDRIRPVLQQYIPIGSQTNNSKPLLEKSVLESGRVTQIGPRPTARSQNRQAQGKAQNSGKILLEKSKWD